MGLFKKKSTDPEELDRLKADIAAMAARLDQSDTDKQALGARVQGIVTRLDTPAPPQPAPPPPPPPAVTENDLHMIRAQIQRLNDRFDQVDARITAISTELANQLTELSADVDAVRTEHAQPLPVSDTDGNDIDGSDIEGVVEEIRDAQVRLASEQARYQIAFRQDLADLVEKLRRS